MDGFQFLLNISEIIHLKVYNGETQSQDAYTCSNPTAPQRCPIVACSQKKEEDQKTTIYRRK